MEIQWSLVIFTALTGTAGWLLAAVAVSEFTGKLPKTALPASATALGLMAVGGLASVTHLSHPERMLEALGHPTSGIFTEALLLGIAALLAIVFIALVVRGSSAGARKAVAVAAAVFGVALSFMAGASYMMAAHANWNTVLLPLGYLGTAIPAGLALYILIAAIRGEGDELGFFPALLAGGGIVAAVLAAADTMVSGGPDALLLGWVLAVIVGGVIPAVVGFILKSKPQAVMGLSAVAMVCALAGAFAFRADMWTAAQFIQNFFSPL